METKIFQILSVCTGVCAYMDTTLLRLLVTIIHLNLSLDTSVKRRAVSIECSDKSSVGSNEIFSTGSTIFEEGKGIFPVCSHFSFTRSSISK